MQRIIRVFIRNRTAVIGSMVFLMVILVAILAPLLSPYDPLAQNVTLPLNGPGKRYLLGTDDFGRDILSRIIWGARISLIVGFSSVLLGMLLGTAIGMIAGYFGGEIGTIIMRATDILMCFPDLILGLGIMAVLGPSLFNLIISIGIVLIPRFIRLAYAPTLVIRDRDYTNAARSIGASAPRIITRHILPNIFGEILVAGTLWVGEAIRLEANLSFIGLGVPPPTPTWGNMVREGIPYLAVAPWFSIFPGLAILIAILSLNMVGDGIRDIADPRLRGV
jgi:peptide/nickel transport system permease protein